METRPHATDNDPHLRFIAVAVFVFMFVLTIVPGVRTVAGLHWGSEVDFYRDGAFVHGLLEGHYGEDPLYKGEHLWYTPLVFGIEAVLVKVTGLSVEETLARAGAWLNALAPITFFIMVWYFFDAVIAVVASAVYLFFLIGQEPAWAVATYSPWLIPVSFFQAFFFVQLILIDRAFRSDRWVPSLAAGAWAGFTFLGHAAPALIAVSMIIWLTGVAMFRSWRQGDRKGSLRRYWLSCGAGAMFVLVSLPLTWYVAGDYGMKVVNRSPFQFTYYALAFHDVRLFLFHNINMVSVLGLSGLFLMLRRKPDPARRMILPWIAVSVLLLLYAYCVAYLEDHNGIRLPGTVPSFHFYFYLKAAMAILAGLALVRSGHWILARMSGKKGAGVFARRSSAALVLLAVVVIAVSARYPMYAHRVDLASFRLRSLQRDHDSTGTQAGQWIGAHLAWNDVLLCDEDLSCWPVMPTARKVVATANTMCNPYVDLRPRQHDRDRMLKGMEADDPAMGGLLDAYGVTHLLLTSRNKMDRKEQERWFPAEVFRNAGYVIYARNGFGAVRVAAH